MTLSGGQVVRVEDLKRGMAVQTLKGPNKVAAVLRTTISSGRAYICHIGDLKITPWHPIVSPDQWVLPADAVSPELVGCDAVYSVLLLPDGDPDAHSMSISDVWCVTLGHGLTSAGTRDDVRSHSFLGHYERVLRELSCLEGFHDEDEVMRCAGTRRNPDDGRICGFIGEYLARDGYSVEEVRGSVCV